MLRTAVSAREQSASSRATASAAACTRSTFSATLRRTSVKYWYSNSFTLSRAVSSVVSSSLSSGVK